MSMHATLKAILSSQTAIHKQMDEILCRVNSLEETVKDTSTVSSNSSSDDRRKSDCLLSYA